MNAFIIRGLLVTSLAASPAALLVSAAGPQRNPYRSELEDVVFYHRLVEGGSGLARMTYAAQETAFLEANRGQLAQAAAFYQALALIELDHVDQALDVLREQTWNGNEDWQRTAAQILLASKSNPGDDAKHAVAKRLAAAANPDWRDPDPGVPASAEDQLHIAAAWARSGQAESLRRLDHAAWMEPQLTLSAEGKVDVDYAFFDPAIFRIASVKRADQLYAKVGEKVDGQMALIALWCEIILHRDADAQQTIAALKQLALDGQMKADQIEELQFLGAAFANQLDQGPEVEAFLEGRIENPPKSPWALRAMNLIRGFAPRRMSVLHQAVAEMCQSSHPFARQVLSNVPAQTERVLDCYWEVAWGHRCRAVAESGWGLMDAPTVSSLRARRLVAELASPTVTESWRERSALRLELILESHVLSGDAESWQLALTDQHLQEHPILEPVIELSRTLSGLQRVGIGKGDVQSLADDNTKDVTHLLLGDDEAARIQPTLASASPARSGHWGLIVPLAVVSAITVICIFIIRLRRGSIR